jgi:hypothetical protein
MCLQGEEMKKETKIDVKNIEEEFQFHGLQAGKSSPEMAEYWRNLGSSKTRTKEQEIIRMSWRPMNFYFDSIFLYSFHFIQNFE